MKIAVAGKGGVGKTTLCGALARTFAQQGWRVLAVDADPDANLASSLPLDQPEQSITPLASQRELLQKRAAGEEALPGLFLLNPTVDDLLPEQTATWGNGQRLLVLGWHKGGGQGCYCAENAVLKRILTTLQTGPQEMVLIDSEAGLEHLSRGTVGGIDAVLAVVEPGQRSLETAYAIQKLAADLEIPAVLPVLSGYRSEEEVEAVQQSLGSWALAAAFPHSEEIRQADLAGRVPEITGPFAAELERLADTLIQLTGR